MNITIRARKLVYEMLELMPSSYQQASLKAMLTLFLSARGIALPEHATHKSPSALSRFLNLYDWPTTSVIRTLRREILKILLERRKVGRRPILRAIVDLTPLQKSGSFEGLAGLVHILNNILNKKRGVQLVVLYLEVDGWRVPWGFRVWRGKGSASPGALALKLLRTLPKTLTARYRVMVLAEKHHSAFCGAEFLGAMRHLGHHAVVGVRRDRRLADGTKLEQLSRHGERVWLAGLSEVPVYVAPYWLKRDGGREKRFVLCTRALSPRHIVRWGKRRWAIEGFFKTAKGRFSLERFGQGSRLGVYRYLALSLVAYLLAHWGHLSQGCEGLRRAAKGCEGLRRAAKDCPGGARQRGRSLRRCCHRR